MVHTHKNSPSPYITIYNHICAKAILIYIAE